LHYHPYGKEERDRSSVGVWFANFINADAFNEQLSSFVKQDAVITGLWRIDKIEILAIEPWERRRR